MPKQTLLGLTLTELQEAVKRLGMPGFAAKQIASWLYETDRHGYPILGNALIIGEKYGNAGIEFCEMSEEQFNLIFPRLKDCEKKLKEERENI